MCKHGIVLYPLCSIWYVQDICLLNDHANKSCRTLFSTLRLSNHPLYAATSTPSRKARAPPRLPYKVSPTTLNVSIFSLNLAGQISASLISLSRTIDDYAENAKKELIPAKQEKAHERIKNFRVELADYRQTLERLKKDREDSVCFSELATCPATHKPWPKFSMLTLRRYSKQPKIEQSSSAVAHTTPKHPRTHTPNPALPKIPRSRQQNRNLSPLAQAPKTTPGKRTLYESKISCRLQTPLWMNTWSEVAPSWAILEISEKCLRGRKKSFTVSVLRWA